jgi:hypothetical protein
MDKTKLQEYNWRNWVQGRHKQLVCNYHVNEARVDLINAEVWTNYSVEAAVAVRPPRQPYVTLGPPVQWLVSVKLELRSCVIKALVTPCETAVRSHKCWSISFNLAAFRCTYWIPQYVELIILRLFCFVVLYKGDHIKQVYTTLTKLNSLEQSHWQANSCSASQQITRIVWGGDSFSCPYPKPDESNQHPPSVFRSILILFSNICLGIPFSSFQFVRAKFVVHLSFPYMPNVLPIQA